MNLAPNKIAARQLRAGAKYVKEHGLARGMLGRDGDSRCMLGAIYSVCRADFDGIERTRAARRFLYLITGYAEIPSYSDGASVEDAIAAFNIAADIAEVGWDE